MEDAAATPLWSAYMARNTQERQGGFMSHGVGTAKRSTNSTPSRIRERPPCC